MEEQARAYLDQIPFWTRKKNTLEAVKDFLHALGDPQQQLKIIHVAGTNGKGSVCADLTSILNQAGYQVGTFISPHLEDVKERFLWDGNQISEETFEKGFRRVRAVTESMMEKGYCHPTFFEFVFLMAMTIYGELRPDFVILETGLGGRLDTTNVIDRPLACVITSISLDHTMYLGDTIAKIASEKAGIIKPGIPVVFDDNQPEASAVIRAKAEELQSPCYPVSAEESVRKVNFAAPYQAMNAALAVCVLKVLALPKVTDEICLKGLRQVYWPGRMEQAGDNIWLDGAHNPGGIRAFIQAVQEMLKTDASDTTFASQRELQLLFAAVSDKDYHDMIQMLCRELPLDRVTVMHLSSERGMDPEVLADQFRLEGCKQVTAYPDARTALLAAISAKRKEDRLYVVGSLYLIGEIKKLLREAGREQNAGF